MDSKKFVMTIILILFTFAILGSVYVNLSTGVFQPGEGWFVTKNQSPYAFWMFNIGEILAATAAGYYAFSLLRQKKK